MFVIDIFDINPLNLEVPFEFQRMVLPPKWKCLLMVTRFQAGNAFKHPTFDRTKEQIGVGILR